MRKKPLHPRVLELRRQLAAELARAFGPDGQFVVGPSCGIPQPRMCELLRGDVERCTMEWLIRHVVRCGGAVTLEIKLGDIRREWMRQKLRERRRALGLPLIGRWRDQPVDPWVKIPEAPAT